MFIVTNEGVRFEGNSCDEVVTAMKLDMWLVPETREDYMSGTADRIETFDNTIIKYHDSESFLKELHRIGVIQEFKEVRIFNLIQGGKN